MALDLSQVKRTLQDHLQEGLLLVVGTGLSIAEGIPGMQQLAEHLKSVIPMKLTSAPDPAWDDIVTAMDTGDHLEAAMNKVTLQGTTVEAIVAATAELISKTEQAIFNRVLSGDRELPFTLFAKHLFRAGKKFHLITPNYDRLVEFAAEAAEIGVDSRFFGYLVGQLNAKRSADAHRESCFVGKSPTFRPLSCLCVHKPHGSIDWFEVNGRLVRCPVNMGKVPMIITPGASKYRESFRWVFDEQRTSGNRAATKATRLMFIGYGFNDDHLEQYLCPGFRLTKPSIILAKDLTVNAKKVIENSNGVDVIALCAVSATDLRTRIVTSNGDTLVVNKELWNLEGFNKEVL